MFVGEKSVACGEEDMLTVDFCYHVSFSAADGSYTREDA